MLKIESPVSQFIETSDDTNKDVYARIMSDIEHVKEVFHEKNEIAIRNYDWYSGRQWTREEIEDHYAQGREPYVFNDIKPKIDNITGTESKTSLDITLEAREVGDEPKVAILNKVLKWVYQTNDFDSLRSEIFQDGVIEGAAPIVIKWKSDDLEYGYPSIETVPTQELYWDSNSRKYDCTDMRWIARVMLMTKMDAYETYPQYGELIDSTLGGIYGIDVYNVDTYRQRQFNNRSLWYLNEGRDLVKVIEHYENIKLYEYIVVDEIQDTIDKFYTHNEAMNYLSGLVDAYSEAGQTIVQADGTNAVFISTVKVNRVIQTVIIGTEVAQRVLTNLNKPPFEIFFSNYNKGDYWGTVDDFISPQKLLNRFFSHYDYSLGVSLKNLVTIIPNLLTPGTTIEDVINEMTKAGAVLSVKTHEAVKSHPQPSIMPELFQGIGFSRNFSADLAGGKSALGQNQYANESGKAAETRANLAGVSRLPMFDKLKQWTKQVTYQVLWWIVNYMTPAQIFRIIGQDDITYEELDTFDIESLKELKYDIVLDETNKSETSNEQTLDMLYRISQMTPGIAPEVMYSMMIPFFNLPKKVKDDMMQRLQFEMEYQKQQAQLKEQQKNEMEARNQLEKRKIKENILASDATLQSKQETEKAIKQQLDFQKTHDEANVTNMEYQNILQNLNNNL